MLLFLGFYFGLLLMMLLYNLHWYNITKEESYLYYSVFKFFIILVILQSAKIVVTNQFCLILSVVILLIFILLFSQEFLELKKHFKKIYITINGVMLLFLLCFIYCVFIDDYTLFEQPYSLVLFPLVIIGCFVCRRGFKPAIYYTVAWGVSIVLVGVGDLNKFTALKFYPNVPFDLIGHIFESGILSYAISVKMNLLVKEKEQQSRVLVHQAKLASMGKMLENISHQWRQPLNRIATCIINMQVHINDNHKREGYLMDTLEQSQLQLQYMSSTINDFSQFNKRDENREFFFISSIVDDAYSIVGQTLDQNGVLFEVDVASDFSMLSYPNDLVQVILNLVQNSQDALLDHQVKKPLIKIRVDTDSVYIQDNGVGIELAVIENIFDPYFTTKRKESSLGLGLYMSKIILDKYFDATIEVESVDQSTTFKITFLSMT